GGTHNAGNGAQQHHRRRLRGPRRGQERLAVAKRGILRPEAGRDGGGPGPRQRDAHARDEHRTSPSAEPHGPPGRPQGQAGHRSPETPGRPLRL
ncbi:MAG: hypothetical protein AVDCRST_MAG02-1833, partial [uncultured Rubrobacteraceae bacterium]